MFRLALITLLIGCVSADRLRAQSPLASTPSLETLLRTRVELRPEDSAAWRMLGHWLLDENRAGEAVDALERAVELDQLAAAAWFDYGRALSVTDEPAAAVMAFETVLDLAPDSEYAAQSIAALDTLATEFPTIQPVDYGVREFNGLEHSNEALSLEAVPNKNVERWPLRLTIDAGVLFNDNVALSPISRSLSADRQDSVQFSLAPDLEYLLLDRNSWRTGPRFGGNFTWNESHFEQFNLQSYRPGWFVEHDIFADYATYTARVSYEFAHDEFRERTYGNRHAVVSSLTGFWTDTQATTFYWSIDHTNFRNDGSLPEITSLDGWTNSLGLTHEISLQSPWMRLIRLGVQGQRSEARGDDNRFNGIGLNGELWIPLTNRLDGRIRGSWGYRDYPDYQSGASRNEHIWSITGELRQQFNQHWSLRLVTTFDRFDSQSEYYDARRFLAGVMVGYQY